MNRRDERALAEQMERDADDPSAWAEEQSTGKKRRLAAQVTVRLDPEQADRLRAIARGQRVGYTSLVRSWIVERLESSTPTTTRVLKPSVVVAGITYSTGPCALSGERVELSRHS